MLDEYLATGANNILCDARADVKEFLRKCTPAKRAFRRNMDSTDFSTISSDDVYTRTMNCLRESEGYPGFILGTVILPYGTPISAVEAARKAIVDYKH
jgi:uroporphyrinogen decarboxylase